MAAAVDHIVVGSVDLDVGVRWIEERLGVAPVYGGEHDGFGTRNALLGLGEQYLEVLALDPEQPWSSSPFTALVGSLHVPVLTTVAIGKSGLRNPIRMSRVRPDGVKLEWDVEFTASPLFFIDWMDCPRPSSSLPSGGSITSLSITTPDPAAVPDLRGVEIHRGQWRVDATINGRLLA